ncbi:hypothetical protein ABIE67_000405 [Streptomyces sp. V4I8]
MAWLALLVLGMLFLPALLNVDAGTMDPADRLAGPSAEHWLGADNYGRDLLARALAGARTSLWIGLGSVAASAVVGVPIGMLAGYLDGWLDRITSFVADVDMRSLEILGDDIVGGAGIDQFTDGGLVQPEFPADRRLRHPLLPQLMGGSMLLTQPDHDLQLFRWLDHLGLHVQVAGAGGRAGRRFGQAGAVGVDRLLDCLAEVGPQMIAVRDLFGLGRPGPSALPVTAGAIPADDPHLGVITEPGGQVLAFAAVVEMHRPVSGQSIKTVP